jgi:flagellar hook assembly protein FlgD
VFAFEAPRPTPATGSASFAFTLDRPARVALVLYDLSGRTVRTLVPPSEGGAQRHQVTWDGKDDRGARVATGLYIVRLTVNGRTLERRLPLLR